MIAGTPANLSVHGLKKAPSLGNLPRLNRFHSPLYPQTNHMAERKTTPTDRSVAAFLEAVPDQQKRQDYYALLTLVREMTGREPRLWGSSMVGFGKYHYPYAGGHQGEASPVGFSPRKQSITLYLPGGLGDPAELMQKLGKVKAGKGCLYVTRLDEVDLDQLREVIQRSLDALPHRPDVKVLQ